MEHYASTAPLRKLADLIKEHMTGLVAALLAKRTFLSDEVKRLQEQVEQLTSQMDILTKKADERLEAALAEEDECDEPVHVYGIYSRRWYQCLAIKSQCLIGCRWWYGKSTVATHPKLTFGPKGSICHRCVPLAAREANM